MKKCKETFEAIAKWVELNGYMQVGGATQQRLLAHFGIDDKTLRNWMKIPEFSELIKKAKEAYASTTLHTAENALTDLAFGKSKQKEIKRTKESDAKGNPVIIQQVETIKEMPPNVTALIFLLKNLAPERWSDKQQVDVSGKPIITFMVDKEDERMLKDYAKRISSENESDIQRN